MVMRKEEEFEGEGDTESPVNLSEFLKEKVGGIQGGIDVFNSSISTFSTKYLEEMMTLKANLLNVQKTLK
jgi:hypothetical protein